MVPIRAALLAPLAALGASLALTPLAAQSADPLGACKASLRGYATWFRESEATAVWRETLRGTGPGTIHLFGASHSRDPLHPQFSELDSAWAAAEATVVFYEGPNREIAADGVETIRTTGESGYLRFLARRDGARIARLEPNPQEEVNATLAHFTPEEVKLFFVLREAARLRGTGSSLEEVEVQTARLLEMTAKMFKGFEGTFATIPELEAAYRRRWSEPSDWRMVPQSWFGPQMGSDTVDVPITKKINRVSSEFRNLHMARMIAAEVQKGERVFVVVGRNHVPMIAPALKCVMRN